MNEKFKTILSNIQIDSFNQLQLDAYDLIQKERSVAIISPTGSGKTLAFSLPLLGLLDLKSKKVQALVIAPSRELALQIESVWRKMQTGFKVSICYGGHDIDVEINNLKNPPALLIATPGRLVDHLYRKTVDCSSVKYLVVDEFDKCLELGFQEQMQVIFQSLPKLDKRVYTSATSAIEIPDYAQFGKLTTLDNSDSFKSTSEVLLYSVISEDKDKAEKLFQLLCNLNSESAIVFCNHREVAERICSILRDKGIDVGFYHGGLEQIDRERVLVGFRNGSMRYLITTDLAARGLDIPDMKHVIHYHLPSKESEFIHRNGRTARMGADGNIYLVLFKGENLPDYVTSNLKELKLKEKVSLPEKAIFETIYISGGKKDKLSKADIVGFFVQKGSLEKDDIGLIELRDFMSFVAVKKTKTKFLLTNILNQKMKGKKYKIEVAYRN